MTKQLDIDHRDVLSLLYAPIIGPEAVSLYFSLHAICDRTQLRSAEHPHSFLFDLLSLSADGFLRARRRLEASGLLESFRDDVRCVYKLYLPLPAERFLKDSPFAAYLHKQLGEERFLELADFFKVRRMKTSHLANTTVAFTDVFAPAYDNVSVGGNYIAGEIRPVEVATAFDIEAVLEALPQTVERKPLLSREAKERLSQIAYIYSLDASTLKERLLQALDEKGVPDFAALTDNCRKLHRNPVHANAHIKKKTSGYDLDYFRRIHPKNLVEDLTGAHVPSSDLAIIEKLITRLDFPHEVVSVLIAYVLRQLDHRFPAYNYFEKVAAEWRRAGVEDAKSAIEHIQKRLKKDKASPRRTGKKDLPEDIEVDWLDDYIEKLQGGS